MTAIETPGGLPEKPLAEVIEESVSIEDIKIEDVGEAKVKESGPPYRLTDPDIARLLLAASFAVIFALTILGTFILFAVGHEWEQLKDLLNLLLPAETALLGSAVGFYFGAREQ